MSEFTTQELVTQWNAAAARSEVVRAVQSAYDDIERVIRAQTPRCEISGRCCHFESFGHRLYVTGLEGALTLRGSGAEGASIGAHECPFQINRACGVHAHRPAGCRVYFCDPAWAPHMNDVAEQAVAAIRSIHDEFAIPYRYMEWRALLNMLAPEMQVKRAARNDSGGVTPTIDGAPLP